VTADISFRLRGKIVFLMNGNNFLYLHMMMLKYFSKRCGCRKSVLVKDFRW
jgi:hypothetical protein